MTSPSTDTAALLRAALDHHRAGRADQAEAAYRQALADAPGHPHASHFLGLLLCQGGRDAEGLPLLRQSAAAEPRTASFVGNLGTVLWERGLANEAIERYREAVRLDALSVPTWENLGGALAESGDLDEATQVFAQGARCCPTAASLRARLLGLMLLTQDPQASFEAHRAFGQAIERGLTPATAYPNPPDPDRLLCVGYLLRPNDTTAAFLEPILARHDPQEVQAFCYADGPAPERLRPVAPRWKDVSPLDPAAFAAAVRADRIDILVDASGHPAQRRLALAPAPVQVAYPLYPATLGLRAVPWRLTDAEPETLFTEHLVPFAPCAWCYRPPRDLPAPGPLPMLRAKRVTFGVFEPPARITPMAVALWSRLLHATPGSRIRLRLGRGAELAGPRLKAAFSAHGITDDRLEFCPDNEPLHDSVDLGLDPLPLNAMASTCEALCRGIPVLTRVTDGYGGRIGASLLRAAELPQCVAQGDDAFISAALRLVENPMRLGVLRRMLPTQLRASSLLDEAGLTAQLETAFRGLWRQWCRTLAADRPA